MRRSQLAAALVLALLAGCDDSVRQRDDLGTGPQPEMGADQAVVDMAPMDDAGPMQDAEADAEPPADGAPPVDAEVLPDMGPAVPEECNGEDDDQDGRIDEGVANVCGGCGGIPPEGCQTWRVNLIQDPDGTLLPGRVVGLQGGVFGVSRQPIEGGECEVLRVQVAPHPDAHLGIVDIEASLANLRLVPVFDDRIGGFRYDPNPEMGRTAVHRGPEDITVRAGGGRLVAAFTETIRAPSPVEGLEGEALRPVLQAARGEAHDAPIVRWDAAPPAGRADLRLFVGGSRPVFGPSQIYRAIAFYQLDARLEDDGEFALPDDLFGEGGPESSIWVYLARQRERRIPLGQHGLSIAAGHRVELRATGANIPPDGAEPPFQITAPSPNTREVVPGEPLPVRWSALPPGEGPLEVSLTWRDSESGEQVQINCGVDDPGRGELILPADLVAGLPTNDDFRQLTVLWGIDRVDLPAPDPGSFTRSVALVLRLDL